MASLLIAGPACIHIVALSDGQERNYKKKIPWLHIMHIKFPRKTTYDEREFFESPVSTRISIETFGI